MRALKTSGLKLELLSGDNPAPVQALAERLGIAEWRAGVLPAEKAARMAELSAQGRKVLMVGDGLNDTAALAAAHVSVSPASALDAARLGFKATVLEGAARAIDLNGSLAEARAKMRAAGVALEA